MSDLTIEYAKRNGWQWSLPALDRHHPAQEALSAQFTQALKYTAFSFQCPGLPSRLSLYYSNHNRVSDPH
jgi:hypothetical protein